ATKMGSKQSSLSDISAETSPDSYGQYANGAGHSKHLKKKSAKKHANSHFATSNHSTPSLRDKIDHVNHLKMGVSFETSDSSDMPEADELERRFLKGLAFSIQLRPFFSLHFLSHLHS